MCSIESKPLDTPSFYYRIAFTKDRTKPALATCSFMCYKKYDYILACEKSECEIPLILHKSTTEITIVIFFRPFGR